MDDADMSQERIEREAPFLLAASRKPAGPVVGWGWAFVAVFAVAVVGAAFVALLDQLVFPAKGGTK